MAPQPVHLWKTSQVSFGISNIWLKPHCGQVSLVCVTIPFIFYTQNFTLCLAHTSLMPASTNPPSDQHRRAVQ